jgi:hypothetical protein
VGKRRGMRPVRRYDQLIRLVLEGAPFKQQVVEEKEPTMDRATPMPAEKEEAPRISLEASIRWGGLLAIVAGAYMLLLPFVHPSDEIGVRSAASASSSKPGDWAWLGS